MVSLRATQKASKAWGPLLGSKLRSSTFWLKLPTLAYDTRMKHEIILTYLAIIVFLQMSFLKMAPSISRIPFTGKTCTGDTLPVILEPHLFSANCSGAEYFHWLRKALPPFPTLSHSAPTSSQFTWLSSFASRYLNVLPHFQGDDVFLQQMF